MKKIITLVSILVLIFAMSITVYASSAPAIDYETDADGVLIGAPDESNGDISALLFGTTPDKVLGDASLADYATYTVFSASAVGDHDFSATVSTNIYASDLTGEDIVVKLLSGGSWSNVPFTFSGTTLSMMIPAEGQVAVFVLDSIEIDMSVFEEPEVVEPSTEDAGGTEDSGDSGESGTSTPKDPATSPKTGDPVVWFGAMMIIGVAVMSVSARKAFRRR